MEVLYILSYHVLPCSLSLPLSLPSLLSSIDLPTDGSAHVDLTLTCNTTHLLYSANIATERLQFFYTYFLAIDCLDANGSQVSYPDFMEIA